MGFSLTSLEASLARFLPRPVADNFSSFMLREGKEKLRLFSVPPSSYCGCFAGCDLVLVELFVVPPRISQIASRGRYRDRVKFDRDVWIEKGQCSWAR